MRKCLFCKTEVPKEDKKCPNCGKPYISKKTLIIGIIVIIFIAMIYSNGQEKQENDNNSNNSNTTNNNSNNNVVEEKEDLSTVATVYELSDGHYTAGVDLPIGKCNVTVISGSGNVSSSNMYNGGMNAIMGVEESTYSIKEFKGLQMNKNVVLSVSNGVTIKLEYTSVTGNYIGRTYDESLAIELGDGNYTVGSDIKAGIYNIVVVSGNGNVSSSNMFDGGINSIMGVGDSSIYIKEHKNVTLNDNGTLTISNGVKVKLIPAK